MATLEHVGSRAAYTRSRVASPFPSPAPALYTIVAAKRHLTISLAGMWDAVLTDRYRADLRRMTAEMVRRGGYRGALLDASDYPIQPADVATEHRGAMIVARDRFGVRAAVVMLGSRPRLQMGRITTDTGHRLFDDRASALSWLLD